jgi:hypothetical protein
MKNKKESEKRGVKPRKGFYFFEKQIRLNCTVRVHVRNLDILLSLYTVIYTSVVIVSVRVRKLEVNFCTAVYLGRLYNRTC